MNDHNLEGQRAQQGSPITNIEICHIFGGSTMQNFRSGAIPNKVCVVTISSPLLSLLPTPIAQDEHASTAITILKRLRLGELANELCRKNGVHRPKNLISLAPDMHFQFDEFGLWFEASGVVCY